MPPFRLTRSASRLCFTLLLALGSPNAFGSDRPASQWVWPGPDGTLDYRETDRGDRIPDFSNAGYGGGGVALPEVPVALTLEPEPGDDTARIQAAIDRLGRAEPGADGFRGAILLKAGDYELSEGIAIRHSGIVLRGEGKEEGGTVLRATGQPGDWNSRLIEIGAPDGDRREVEGTRTEIADAYVPVGARSFRVEDASGLSEGDPVIAHRRVNDRWVRDLGMDGIPDGTGGRTSNQWDASQYNYDYDRVIVAIDGNVVTLDAPLGDAVDATYGGGALYAYTFPERITGVGIENLKAVAVYSGDRDEDGDHFRTMIRIDRAENAWVRDVRSYHFGFGQVRVRRRAKWVTIQDCEVLEPAARIGGSRRYGFYLYGQLALVQRCFANEDRHAFAWNQRSAGPNVFLDCHAVDSNNDMGPHHRWSTAGLTDNVRIPDHAIRVQNRLHMGNGHGWAGANFVVWNSSANEIVVHSPPIAQNWAIGVTGEKRKPQLARIASFRNFTSPEYLDEHGTEFPPEWGFDEHGDRYWDSHNQPVRPVSLYLAQLADRLGPGAVGNINDRPYSFQDELETEIK